MPRKNSVKTLTSEQSESVVPVIETTTPPPQLEKKVRKAKNVVKPEEVVENVVEVTTSTSSTTEPIELVVAEVETPLAEQSTEFITKLQQLGTLLSALKTEYRVLEKKWTREVKAAQKISNKRKRKAGNRAPSGFVKPTKISDELAKFLGKDKGAEMARTDVTREINTYIRANNLQDKENGRKINPDSKLAQLLKLNKSDELTYFNLQKYMSPHFAKAIKEEVVSVA
jgi:upstream activation factor subunit UAF30